MVRITISGTPGSGKTTVARLVHEQTKLEYVYSGDIFRDLAKQHQKSLEEFGRYCEQHPQVDKQLDKKQLDYLKQEDIIVEGRLAGWLAYQENIPAVKVFITADETIRAQRIVNREGGTVSQRKKELQTREQSEAKRYRDYYNIDLFDTSIYDLVIDSSQKSAENIAQSIITYIENP